jgi:hypothetical protein
LVDSYQRSQGQPITPEQLLQAFLRSRSEAIGPPPITPPDTPLTLSPRPQFGWNRDAVANVLGRWLAAQALPRGERQAAVEAIKADDAPFRARQQTSHAQNSDVMHLQPEFLMSIDAECFTAMPRASGDFGRVANLHALVESIAQEVPSLPAPTGVFTGYGRVYLDCCHVELAAAECASPYEVPVILEQLERLVALAAAHLREQGTVVLVGTSTHSGRLGPRAPSWGAHENYLLGKSPAELADRALPFLVTRVFAGAGGIWAPTGEFVAGTRLTALTLDRGGGTTAERAIFSTARQEHLARGRPGIHRCHLILGDGHRSHWSLALQLGATALVLRAIEAEPDRVVPFARREGADQSDFWLAAIRSFNTLAMPGERPAVHPRVLEIQRFYLDLARRFVSRLSDPHPWTGRLLRDWAETLNRLEDGDEDWLAVRLDPWIKRRLFSAWLAQRGASWDQVPRRPDLLDGLALLDQDYHTFAGPLILFDRLEAAGLIEHRTVEAVAPGGEAEPFVPAVASRARARARFIRTHSGTAGLLMDWAAVFDLTSGRSRRLDDPFATEFGPWRSKQERSD